MAVSELLIAEASLALEHRFRELRLQHLQLPGSRAQGQFTVSCSSACGILPDQELNSCLLPWAGGFFTTEPPGKPTKV